MIATRKQKHHPIAVVGGHARAVCEQVRTACLTRASLAVRALGAELAPAPNGLDASRSARGPVDVNFGDA